MQKDEVKKNVLYNQYQILIYGTSNAVVFSKPQKDFARLICMSEVLTIEGSLPCRGGYGLSISIIVEKVILPWSGLLSDALCKPEANKG